MPGLRVIVQGSGFRVQGSGFRVQGSGFRVQGSGFRVQGWGFSLGSRGTSLTWMKGTRLAIERAGSPADDPTSNAYRGERISAGSRVGPELRARPCPDTPS